MSVGTDVITSPVLEETIRTKTSPCLMTVMGKSTDFCNNQVDCCLQSC